MNSTTCVVRKERLELSPCAAMRRVAHPTFRFISCPQLGATDQPVLERAIRLKNVGKRWAHLIFNQEENQYGRFF